MAILFTVRLCKISNSYLIRTFFCTNIKVRGGRQQGLDHVQESELQDNILKNSVDRLALMFSYNLLSVVIHLYMFSTS